MTGAQILDRTTTRLGDTVGAAAAHYDRTEILVAVNQVYRLLCFLTLCLETTVTYSLSAGGAFHHMLATYADWILPLRIRSAGVKLFPNRLVELAALNSSWSAAAGTPERYAHLGFDLLCIYKQPASPVNAQIVYARTPTPLTDSSTEPEILEEYHQALIDGAVSFLRVKEGAQEWQKTLGSWARYMAAVRELGDAVRARNKELGYDHEPFELTRFDRSTVLEVVKNG